MATKSILEIESIDDIDKTDDSGNLLYGEDSSVFINTGGGSRKLRQINIKKFFSRIGSFISDIGLIYTGNETDDSITDKDLPVGYGYKGEPGTKALDARFGSDILIRIAAAEENAKAYFDSQIESIITELKGYADTKKEEAITAAKEYTDSRMEAVIEEAKAEAVKEAEEYINSRLESALTETENNAITSANQYTDSAITAESTVLNNRITGEIEDAVKEAKAYTDSEIEKIK